MKRLLKKYRVAGFALVPQEAVVEVEASCPEHALRDAHILFVHNKADYLVANSQDENSAFDWQPTVEEIK